MKNSLDIRQRDTEALRELFPNIFSEGKIDLEKFKAAFCVCDPIGQTENMLFRSLKG